MPSPAFVRLYYLMVFGGLGLYLPFFPSWLLAQGFLGAEMSLLVSLVPLLGFFSPPLVGMLADELGLRARVMVLTCLLSAVGMTALAVAGARLAPLPFTLVLVPMAVFAAFRGPMVGLADALLLEQASNYGRVRLFGSIGFLLTAGGLGRVVDVDHPYQLPALIGGIYWVASVIAFILPKATQPRRPGAWLDARRLLGQSRFRWLLACGFLSFLSHSSYDLCASLRLRDLGETEGTIGLFWALGTFSEIFMMYGAKGTIQRRGAARLLCFALILHACRWIFLAYSTDRTLILALQPLHAVTFGLMWLCVMEALKQQLGGVATATGQGLMAASIAAGNTLGMWVWGMIYDARGSSTVFQAAAVTAVFGSFASAVLVRQSPSLPLEPARNPRS